MTSLKLKIDRPAYGNISIGRHNGKIVMVKGAALPGEIVETVILKEKKDYLTAAVRTILEPSPDRIEPECNHFGTCGGCHFQHMPYNLQVKLKEEILADCLTRLSKIDIDLSPSIINNNPWNYRLRGQFKISSGSPGFFRENTREMVFIDSCPIMVKEINDSLVKIKTLIKGYDLKEVHLTSGTSNIALLKTTSRARAGRVWNKLASGFLNSGFSGLFIEKGNTEILKYGRPHITLALEKLKYMISPMSFFQSNWELNLSVIEIIKKHLHPLKNMKVLDLYAGAGNFSLPLAEEAEVTAVEENPFAIHDSMINLKKNNISNCEFIRSSAEKYHPEGYFDIVILDPPRPGLTNGVMEKVLLLMPEKIVYISCNPTTFARDLKKLSLKYNIKSVRMIDFFPQTFHIESLAFLYLK